MADAVRGRRRGIGQGYIKMVGVTCWDAVRDIGIEIIHKGGAVAAGMVLGAAVTVAVTIVLSKRFFKSTSNAEWHDLVDSVKAERNRYCSRVQDLEKELSKIKKGTRR